ncbi:MAG: hypothetical protein V3W41_04760 [Planctomycetota bacterium]
MPSQVVSTIVAAFAGVLVGAFVVWGVLGSSVEGDPNVIRSHELSQQRAQLSQISDDLRETVKHIGSILARRSTAPIPEDQRIANRDAVTSLDEQSETLIKAIQELTKTIRGLTEFGPMLSPPISMWSLPQNKNALHSASKKPEVDVTLSSLGATYQQLLDRFGKPDRVVSDMRAGYESVWYYDVEPQSIAFSFRNGRVIRFSKH